MSQSSADGSPSATLPEAGFKLSPQQQRLWQLCHSSSAYRICGAVEIEGDLDSARLESAVRQVVEGHEILRTRFVRQPGSRLPLQAPTGSVAWNEAHDIAALPSEEQTAEFDRLWAAFIACRTEEQEGAALRLQLVRLSTSKYRLLLNLSPLCGDEATVGLLVRAIASAYAALPEAEYLPTEGLPYFQFAAWQNELLETPDAMLEEAQAYWSSLPSPAPVTGLPVRRELSPLPGFAPERVVAPVNAALCDALGSAAADSDVTEAGLLFACWCAYLWRWTQSDEALLSYVSDGRSFDELRDVMGLVARGLPVTHVVTGDMSFRALAVGIEARLEAAQEWQDYFLFAPTATGDEETPAALELAFEYEERLSPQSAAGLNWTLCRQDVVLEPFQLKLGCIRTATSLTLELVYDSYMYARSDAERLLQGCLALVRDAVRHPERRIDRLQLVGDEQRKALTARFNETARAYPEHRCFHELFEEQALRTPEAVAVRFGSDALTYGELDARAGKLATRLQELGVVPESLVALCLTRSPELVVALLAVLKAGGAYIPLEASYPPERLGQILEDAAPTVVLTRTDLADRLPQSDTPPLCIDSDPWLDGNPLGPGVVSVGPENLAYILFTSGSTGRPKGVMVPHRGLVNYLHWAAETYEVSGGAGTIVDTPVGFDLTITSLLSPLIVGQTAVLVPEEDGLEGLAEALQRQTDVTLVKTTPSHLEVLSNLLPPEAAGASRLFVIGGEALRWDTLAFFQRNAPGTRLVNEYGPTETVVGCCVYEATELDPSGSAVPIGRPIANTQLYLFDAGLQPVPLGMPGELYVGGAGVARGYLDRPDLTAERFVPDPFSPKPGARLYKTGDLCRYLPDGNLEYLGRTDYQVKIRGYRIELGEIENVLLTHPGVSEALVLAREDTPGEKRLVAYLIGEEAVGAGVLREYLQDRLPDYMVPAAFVTLDALPLSANGKVDRKALPAPDVEERAKTFVAARTPIEEGVAQIWCDVLHLEQMSIHDSFFELGGHSLLATQVISRIRNTFQVELLLRSFFEAPTIASLAEQISRARGDESALAPPLAPASRERDLPLSFSQQRLWFLDQLEPGSSVYTIPLAIRLTGSLDMAALERSLQEIVTRHEALRTTFALVEGVPHQVIGTDSLFLDLLDLSGLFPRERDAAAQECITQEQRRPFDLVQGPLFRSLLLRLGEQEHILLLSLHHIISDGWSVGVLLQELTALYNAFATDKPSPLAPLPLQYADYAVWQRDWLQGEVLARQIAYWKQHLEGAPALLALPTDRPRPPMQTFQGAILRMEFPEELRAGLKRLSRQEGATLFMTLLAAFQVLLYRYSGQDQIVVGTPIANRTYAEIEGLIGFFMNTLALRGDLSGDPSFSALLGRVRETALGAYAHQDLPFEKLVEELQPERNLSHAPIFQIVFGLQNAPEGGIALEGLQVEGVGSETVTAKYDLLANVSESPQGLRIGLEYNTDLFDATTIARLLSHFQTLLEGIVAEPTQRISRLPMLSPPERQQLMVEWNATEAPYPQDRCLHQLIEDQVLRTPEAVALICEEQRLTYQQLNARANQLAHFLHKQGVRPQALVGLCLERSLEMVVSLLAILKTGAAYVPLDPFWPKERIHTILTQSGVASVVTQTALRSLLPDTLPHTFCLDQEAQNIDAESPLPVVSAVTSGHLAYVLHTSGSTGAPKGVPVPHRAVVNFLASMARAPGLEAQDVLVAVTTLSFDIAGLELYLPLMVGARVVLASRETAMDGVRLGALLEASEATVMQATPSTWRLLLDCGRQSARGLKVLCGGEALPWDLAERLVSEFGGVWNLYGPTETTIWSSVEEITTLAGPLSIGRPIANTQMYVLDRWLSPVGVGVTGELYIGGDGLAWGYLKRPELTAEKFVADPFSSQPGARMYRTGDLARYLPDGNIECLGRVDHQVKIRGFRIELGEIESVLSQHPGVKEAIVVAREDAPGEKRLVAYVVGMEEGALSVSALREHLAAKLPGYMVPAAFVFLPAMPLSANGKIDRKLLPVPEGGRPEVESAYGAPQTSVQETLARIWGEVLRLERVGIHDNFFELGGDSILSIQIIARANAVGLRLTPRQVFQHQTIAGLAAVVGTAPEFISEQGVIEGPVPLTPIQRWFFEMVGSEVDHFNQARLLELRSSVRPALVANAVKALLAHHDALRLRFVPMGKGEGVWEQTNAPEETGDVFSEVNLSEVPEAEQSAAITAVCARLQASLIIQTGPLLRVAYIDLGPNTPARLLLAIHHLAMDGVSWRVLLEDLELGIEQQRREAGIVFPAKTTSYRRWAERLENHAQSASLRTELNYWAAVTDGNAAALPQDFAGGHNLASSQQAVRVSLGVEETRALLQDVPSAYQTQINDVLLTALAQAFRTWTGESSLLVDLEGHGREALFEEVDLSRTVGWFTSLYPVLLELPDASNPSEALKGVKEMLRRIPNGGIGYGLLRYLSAEEPTRLLLANRPKAEVSFNYHGRFDQAVQDSELLAAARESNGPSRSPLSVRSHLLDVVGQVTQDQLQVAWIYSEQMHQRSTIERLAQSYVEALRELIAHCKSPNAGGFTPSDFPKAKVSQKALDRLFTGINKR